MLSSKPSNALSRVICDGLETNNEGLNYSALNASLSILEYMLMRRLLQMSSYSNTQNLSSYCAK